jgi:hypothetical protein
VASLAHAPNIGDKARTPRDVKLLPALRRNDSPDSRKRARLTGDSGVKQEKLHLDHRGVCGEQFGPRRGGSPARAFRHVSRLVTFDPKQIRLSTTRSEEPWAHVIAV